MTVLVTGAAGFIGSHMVRRLVSLNNDVHVLVKSSSKLWRLKDLLGSITIHTESITDRHTLAKLFRQLKPEGIFHFAAAGTYADTSDYPEMIRVNIDGTLSLLEATMDIPYRIFVNIGSSAEYGIKKSPMKETDILEPMSFYAATKASSTILATTFAKLHNKPIVTLRPFTVYGPYEESFRFIPTAIRSTIDGSSLPLTKETVRHDFIYIDDFIDACVSALNKGDMLVGAICNIGTGRQYTNQEVVGMIFSVIGKKTKIVAAGFAKRGWDSNYWVADTSQSQRLLGWTASTTLAQGLKKTYTWFAAHRDYAKASQKRG